MDVHKESLVLAVFKGDTATADRVDRLPNDLSKLHRYIDRLAAQGPLRICYEASGAGYVLQRALQEWGYACEVIAPSLIPTKPGVQRKHDKYDAVQLARLYRAGELTPVRIPSAAEERVRDLVRCRTTFQREVTKSRHYVVKLLARRGFIFREGMHWARAHMAWLAALARDTSPLAAEDRFVLREYLALLEFKLQRRIALDREIEALALTPAFQPTVARLRCFRGIQVHAAMVLATEIGDWERFAHPGQLSAYLGLVPREDSTGRSERRGSLTKAGNAHCRHVLVQAAWSARHRPAVSSILKARQRGQPPGVIAHAWKAQHRLHKLYGRLTARRPSQIAVVAVAREFVGFLWAVMREHPPIATA
jgi:transposase